MFRGADYPIKIVKYNYHGEIIDTYEIPRNEYIMRDEEDRWKYEVQNMLIRSGTTYKKCYYAIKIYWEDDTLSLKEWHFCCEPYKDENSKLDKHLKEINPNCRTSQYIIEKINGKWLNNY